MLRLNRLFLRQPIAGFDEEAQQPTSGIFYCRNSAEINGCGSHETLCRIDSESLRNRQHKHTANSLLPSQKYTLSIPEISQQF